MLIVSLAVQNIFNLVKSHLSKKIREENAYRASYIYIFTDSIYTAYMSYFSVSVTKCPTEAAYGRPADLGRETWRPGCEAADPIMPTVRQ